MFEPLIIELVWLFHRFYLFCDNQNFLFTSMNMSLLKHFHFRMHKVVPFHFRPSYTSLLFPLSPAYNFFAPPYLSWCPCHLSHLSFMALDTTAQILVLYLFYLYLFAIVREVYMLQLTERVVVEIRDNDRSSAKIFFIFPFQTLIFPNSTQLSFILLSITSSRFISPIVMFWPRYIYYIIFHLPPKLFHSVHIFQSILYQS